MTKGVWRKTLYFKIDPRQVWGKQHPKQSEGWYYPQTSQGAL